LYHSIIILQYYYVIDNDNSSSCYSIGLHGASIIAAGNTDLKSSGVAKLITTSK